MYDIGLLGDFEVLDPGRKARAETRFPEGHPVFAGHFPGLPVLPGVIQMALVLEAVEKLLGMPIEIARVKQAKFRVLVKPGDPLVIDAEILTDTRDQGLIEIKGSIRKAGKDAADAPASVFKLLVSASSPRS